MFGWLRAEAARASCSKRRAALRVGGEPAGSVFSAISRPRRGSRARKTSPIPPAPSGPLIWYGPSCAPGSSAMIRARAYHDVSQAPSCRMRAERDA